jgi:hypothetical protein
MKLQRRVLVEKILPTTDLALLVMLDNAIESGGINIAEKDNYLKRYYKNKKRKWTKKN